MASCRYSLNVFLIINDCFCKREEGYGGREVSFQGLDLLKRRGSRKWNDQIKE